MGLGKRSSQHLCISRRKRYCSFRGNIHPVLNCPVQFPGAMKKQRCKGNTKPKEEGRKGQTMDRVFWDVWLGRKGGEKRKPLPHNPLGFSPPPPAKTVSPLLEGDCHQSNVTFPPTGAQTPRKGRKDYRIHPGKGAVERLGDNFPPSPVPFEVFVSAINHSPPPKPREAGWVRGGTREGGTGRGQPTRGPRCSLPSSNCRHPRGHSKDTARPWRARRRRWPEKASGRTATLRLTCGGRPWGHGAQGRCGEAAEKLSGCQHG